MSWIVVARAELADFADQGTPPPIFPNKSGPHGARDVSNEEPSHVGE